MRILILGNADSIWIRNFIKYVLFDENFDVALLDTGGSNKRWENEYKNMGVTVFHFPPMVSAFRTKSDKTLIEKGINLFLCSLYLRKLCKKFDCINMQYVELSYFQQMIFVSQIRKKLILSFWGSDLLRRSPVEIKKLENTFRFVGCKFVTFDNGDLQNGFMQCFGKFNIPRKVIMLPLPILDEIDKTSDYVCGKIAKIEISQEKILIAVGYNAGEAQQHIKVIDSLGKMAEAYRNKVVIILQMTYGGNEEYVTLCKKKCTDAGFECIIFRNYLSENEVALLRNKIDIYINAQVTDAFSGSFCEYLYSGALVINARWLHYWEIDQYKISCIEFDDFDNLSDLVETYINNPEYFKINRDRNRDIIWRLRAVKSCKKQWQSLLLH